MQQIDPPPVLVSRRGPPRRRREGAPSIDELERALSNHEEATRAEIERGVRAMYRGAVRLMRQVASEAWAAGGPEAEERFRDRILQTLARDDAFRALLGQLEERQQGVTLRLERIEAALRNLIRANREALTGPGATQESELNRRLETLSASVAEVAASAARREGNVSALRAEVQAASESVHRAAARSAPSPEHIAEAAARGAERAARAEVSRLEAAVGRLLSVEQVLGTAQRVPDGAPADRRVRPGAAGADERLRHLQRRLAWASARIAAAGGSGNGGPAS